MFLNSLQLFYGYEVLSLMFGPQGSELSKKKKLRGFNLKNLKLNGVKLKYILFSSIFKNLISTLPFMLLTMDIEVGVLKAVYKHQ